MRGNIILFLLEVASAGRDVRLGDNDRVVGDLRLQRDRIAATGHADRLRINGSGAVLADHSLCSLVKADGAADFARVKEGSDFSVGLLIKPEPHFNSAFLSF